MNETKIGILSVSSRIYPMQRREAAGIAVKAVLVAGEANDYACYVGIGDAEWVAMHGAKISFDEARCHFPGRQLERANYRL